MSNIIDKKIFKRIFGHTFETLANKLINTTNKEENQIIVNNISKNKTKLYEEDKTGPFYDYVIQPSDRGNNLFDAITLILDFNEKFNSIWFENIKLKELKDEGVILIGENSQILLSILCHQKKLFFLCMYKMYLISAKGYKNAKVDFLTITTISKIWVNMKDVGSGMGVKNISDLVLKEIYGICETKNPTKKTS